VKLEQPKAHSLKTPLKLIFLMFLLSGFCGILYQIVWLRKAFAAFGIITPVLSLVISIFMLGLSLGSLAGGKLAEYCKKNTNLSPIILYSLSEFIIGLGAFAVPKLFIIGENILLFLGETNSFIYVLLSAFVITGSILPWCFFMGMTFPLMMGFINETNRNITTSFSFLYLANVIGAMLGAFLPAVALIELLGFTNTLTIAAFFNFSIALISLYLGYKYQTSDMSFSSDDKRMYKESLSTSKVFLMLTILFTTGFCSMAMEVVWTRAFTPVLKTTIYAFATLLTVYLCATWIGSYFYRRHASLGKSVSLEMVCALTLITSLLPLILNDPRLQLKIIGIIFSIIPFCMLLGYLTPQLIDVYSNGKPSRAGNAYAINIIGCILGPLFAGYFLLPLAGVKWGLITLSISFVILFLISIGILNYNKRQIIFGLVGIVLIIISMSLSTTYEEMPRNNNGIILRDHTATVIAVGKDMEKQLLINGIGMTRLTPTTKFMAHLPMAFSSKIPKKVLVICFGMGTTFRSFMSWNIKVTAIELIPSVKNSFPFFFDDALQLNKNSNGQIIIDDGRRYLKRTREQYDVIAIDPPPPVEAAGSSLLYSKEFYALIKTRLSEYGIVQQWYPRSMGRKLYAVSRSIKESFPYIKVFKALKGNGYHYFASMKPFAIPAASTFIARMPERAKVDLMEWFPNMTIETIVEAMLKNEISIESISSSDPSIYISDDRPYNEYFILRQIVNPF